MLTLSFANAVRLLNLCMILSGSLSIFGIIALHEGWVNTNSKSNSSSLIIIQSKQNEKPMQEAGNPLQDYVISRASFQQEPPLLMHANRLMENSIKTGEKNNDEAINNNLQVKSKDTRFIATVN